MKYHIEEESSGSIGGFDRLVQHVLQPNEETQSDGFNLGDIPIPFSTKKFLDDLDKKGIEPLGVNDKWIQGSVMLKLPCVGRHQKEIDAPQFTVTNIYYRPLLDTIREVLQGPLFQTFHTTPFSLRYDPTFDFASGDILLDDAQPTLNEHGLPQLPPNHEEVFGEIYTSRAMLEAYHSIPQPPPPESPESPVESIIVAIMVWSDATHLAQFGAASLWPGYTFFGNHPKGFRGKPSSNAGFHQAYFGTFPDSIRDAYREQYGCDMADDVYRHLKRELMHRIWDLLLSEDFIDAYDNGIKIRCWDGVVRLVFPRFFIYGADYPEKVLLATIRSLGGRPCPRCFIEKSQISETGTVYDMKRREVLRVDDHHRRQTIEDARRAIFDNGFAVGGPSIDNMLKSNSWVPVRNAFSKLNTEKTPFNFYAMFVPDLLHEVELGVAKAIIIHVIRMLQTFKKIDEFDSRFRQIETFGRSGIRAFSYNVSDMKYAAARNFEDVLQCILPVVDGLFPLHQKLVDQLFFELAIWHGYAKLRMHTTTTIELFRTATKDLLTSIRRFSRETTNVKTYELPREERRRVKKVAKATSTTTSATPLRPSEVLTPTQDPNGGPPEPPSIAIKPTKGKQQAPAHPQGAIPSGLRAQLSELPGATSRTTAKKSKAKQSVEKSFNLITYKLHSLPDYPDFIARFGTTDSTSTQIGELAHRFVKHLYNRTNKRDHVNQIAKHEHRRRLMRAMWERRKRSKRLEKRTNEKTGSGQSTVRENESFVSRSGGVRNRRERLSSALCPGPHSLSGHIYVPPEQHHYISDSKRTYWRLSDIADCSETSNEESASDTEGPPLDRMEVDPTPPDPALQDFTRKLKTHFRHRLQNLDSEIVDEIEFTEQDLINVVIEKELLYTHATMQVNYTTYDVRRDQDKLNPRTRRFFMVHARDPVDPHRYWYGEILGIFHAYVLLADLPGNSKRLEFLWVRWFQRDVTYPCGFKAKRFPRLHYMPHQNPNAFGFLDPQDVVRGVHLIPAFNHGWTEEYLPKSVGRRKGNHDWRFHFVNLVADRDMLMRFHDNVIGHRKIVPVLHQHTTDAAQTNDDLDAMGDINHNNNLGAQVDVQVEDDSTIPSIINLQNAPLPTVDSSESNREGDIVVADDEEEDDSDWRAESSESGSDEAGEDEEELFGEDAIRHSLGFANE
ncbi:hypothetical protein MIND_01130500 [Mycena indigotica]|uniref:Uncharacterized protein n=1 Tax=Mycena indigotica TaxID=2126181 RepID=A0A8H6VTM9_9AGAR|nr:uncharacterized protein MIND_01130500 [Mycena indigotica]KAF7293522.1 hypothetical protein MIND_01130500 [Mycena indigotica]